MDKKYLREMAKVNGAYLNTLNYNELVKLLVKLKWNAITDLFQYNDAAREFYSNDDPMRALFSAVEQRGSQYNEKDSMGIPMLIEVIKAGYYLGFYN